MTDIPQVTVADIRELLASGAEEPVLYVQNGPDDEGGEQTLAVWARALVPRGRIACTFEEVTDAIGDEPDDDDITGYLPGVQDEIDRIVED